MGEEDTIRQALNVYRGARAEVSPKTGTATPDDFRGNWSGLIAIPTLPRFGMGPHPPAIAVTSAVFRNQKQTLEASDARHQADFQRPQFIIHEDAGVRLIGKGRGIDTFETAATINTGRVGIFHGMKSYFCQDKYGQIAPVYSISAGLDYPGVGPEHAHLHDIGRAEYVPVTDDEAVNAFEYLAKTEGIIPAIESAHAVAHAMKIAPTMDKDKIIVITISGRGDKDCAAIARYRGEDIHE